MEYLGLLLLPGFVGGILLVLIFGNIFLFSPTLYWILVIGGFLSFPIVMESLGMYKKHK